MDNLTQYLNVETDQPRSSICLLVCLQGISIFLLTTISIVVLIGLGDMNDLIKDAHDELTDLSLLLPKAQ